MLAGYAKALIPQCPKEFRVSLAIFDLDNTLLHGDSDYLWGQFLVEQQIVDATEFAQANRYFYQQYEAGSLNISEYLEFSLSVLTKYSPDELHAWRQQFIEQKIKPIILPQGRALLDQHRQQGDTLLIITATNAFVTTPIAATLGVEHLIACDVECIDGRYTGRSVGTPSFQQGKVTRLQQWLEQHPHDLSSSYFYSDSHNDIPLLSQVNTPVAVDPDNTLRQHAAAQGWRIISLRDSQDE